MLILSPLRNLIKAFLRRSYFNLARPSGLIYSYAAINVLKASGLATLYQPLYGVNPSWILGKIAHERVCEDRWQLIESRLHSGPGTFLDLGSQVGYFVFKMQERDYLGIGLERDRPSCSVARHLARINGVNSVIFLDQDITPQSLSRLPTADITFCLSIFHHWVREKGLEYATTVMQAVAGKCNSQLFFETGQNDEISGRWPEVLNFMGNDPKSWIMDYLASFGFTQIELLGEVPTHLSSTNRYLFAATKVPG